MFRRSMPGMCGRFTLATPAEIVAQFFELAETPDLPPRYNIAPTQNIAAVILSHESGRREVRNLRWGLMPAQASGSGSKATLINARAETVAVKPAFRSAFRHRRCLVIADGFYEWRKLPKCRQPYYLQMADGSLFAFAGLWEHWQGPEGGPIDCCALITTGPNRLVAEIHDRMPVIVDRPSHAAWLDAREDDMSALQSMLRPFPAEKMKAVSVSTRVNSATNDDAGCTQPCGLWG